MESLYCVCVANRYIITYCKLFHYSLSLFTFLFKYHNQGLDNDVDGSVYKQWLAVVVEKGEKKENTNCSKIKGK